jgi:hypothetical protein
VGIAILLTILFGPLGMLYSTIWGAVIMCVIGIPFVLITAGFGYLLVWPVSVVWAALAANSYNKKILSGQRQA